eukprot:gene16563-19681_t
MIRLTFDKTGTGHDDLFLRIGTEPAYLKTADSYYLFDFLEISDEEIKSKNLKGQQLLSFGLIRLLDYWTSRITSIEPGQCTFLPFDFSDEYIGGLLIEARATDFKLKPVWTDQIHGYAVGQSNLDAQIKNKDLLFKHEVEAEWMIDQQTLLGDLELSKKDFALRSKIFDVELSHSGMFDEDEVITSAGLVCIWKKGSVQQIICCDEGVCFSVLSKPEIDQQLIANFLFLLCLTSYALSKGKPIRYAVNYKQQGKPLRELHVKVNGTLSKTPGSAGRKLFLSIRIRYASVVYMEWNLTGQKAAQPQVEVFFKLALDWSNSPA